MECLFSQSVCSAPSAKSWHEELSKFKGALVVSGFDFLYLIDLDLTTTDRSSHELTDIELVHSLDSSNELVEVRADGMAPALKLKTKSENEEITCLNFSARTSLLLIGLAGGQVRLYCLKTMRLVWTCENPDSEFGRVTSLFIQEPENDPRKCCWLWFGAQLGDLAQLELYSVEFVRRDIVKTVANENGRSTLYSGLRQVVHRFSHSRIGRLRSAFPLELWQKYDPVNWDDWCGSSPSTSHAVFALAEDSFRLVIFDLNQYYNSRFPTHLGKPSNRLL